MMRKLLRRWFGLKCVLLLCGCHLERPNGLLCAVCSECGKVRVVLS